MPDIRKKIVEEVRVIPPLSKTANDLLRVTQKEDYGISEVVEVVGNDPMLTGQLLKIANSAALARRNPVETILDAVSYLGNKLVLGIALGASATSIYEPKLVGYESSEGSLWLHCLRTAIVSKEIAKYTNNKVDSSAAYTAGLLHDIGKAVLSVHLKERLSELRELFSKSSPQDFCQTEREIIGVDHCQIGELIGSHWNLPKSLKNVIVYHHTPKLAPEEFKPLCYTIHISDMIAMMAGSGTGVDSLHYPFDVNYEQYITIDRTELDRLILQMNIEFAKTSDAINEAKE